MIKRYLQYFILKLHSTILCYSSVQFCLLEYTIDGVDPQIVLFYEYVCIKIS